ncbi:hypothetical protein [Arthrobacter nitrophenolicus]|uniref:Uncharacterized protein n=1 Tax=Arthrobacter nitrophenolicus TaxID=683150 RepID=L8TLS6_9MICC|nr:hypothetical protein [Arthrobacter nitrophenolicus]ELT42835.1 hypothetical protein G205_22051 [Arthrobacter nitrophenolicus]
MRADAVPAPPGERSPAGAHQEHTGGDGREVGTVGLRACRVTAAAWVAFADRVTGVFQFEDDDGVPLEGAVADGVADAPVSVGPAAGSAGISSTEAVGAAGFAAGVEGAAVRGAAGAAGSGAAVSEGSSSGLAVRVGRASGVQVSVGSCAHSCPQPGAVVEVSEPVGSGDSASAAPPVGSVIESASTAAVAVAEAARISGVDGVMDTFRCAQSPVCGFLVSQQSSTTRRRAANPSNVRPS